MNTTAPPGTSDPVVAVRGTHADAAGFITGITLSINGGKYLA